MHLRSITLKGFKSFPDRTKLDFSPGVSVVVGPNGSGKSNVTDAVLWAMGEQSPVAVRGQSMQDVIFAGAHGVQARSEAEVEVVLDNSDSAIELPLSEISIVRRLNRAGEGEYRVNGARCRLTDVLELLSDTGLGKEMHSVVSQGRVAEIVTSKPRDRRLLIEEAAGLGKHRKRRRRAQLKLDRTQDNLDRALDVEREARTRLRPLKRQAEAAELHERLERQTDEARWTLARDAAREAVAALASAEAQVAAARSAADATEAELREVARRREQAEEALAARGDERESLNNRFHAARSAHERIGMRLDAARQAVATLGDRAARRRAVLEALSVEAEEDVGDEGAAERVAALETELEQLAQDRAERLAQEVAELEARRAGAAAGAARLGEEAAATAAARDEADAAAEAARGARRDLERAAEAARRDAARVGAELAKVNQFLRAQAGAPGGAPALADALSAEPGYELALAAALGPRLRAAVASDLAEAERLLDRAGGDGGAALVAPGHDSGGAATGQGLAPGDDRSVAGDGGLAAADDSSAGDDRSVAGDSGSAAADDSSAGDDRSAAAASTCTARLAAGDDGLAAGDDRSVAGDGGSAAADDSSAGDDRSAAAASTSNARPAAADDGSSAPAGPPPARGAERLADRVNVPAGGAAARLARALLSSVWVVDDLGGLDPGFRGVAVTRDGRVWSPGARELRQVPAGGEDRVLAERNRRDALIAQVEQAARAEQAALAEVEEASAGVHAADAARDEADRTARAAARARDEALEAERHAGHLIEQRRKSPDEGPVATRRAQIGAALAAERRLAERAERERSERERRIAHERDRLAHDEALGPAAERLASALAAAQQAVHSRVEALDAELVADRHAGERLAGELRACAQQEVQVQARLKARGEEVTRGEVRAQQARDQHGDARAELERLAGKLGLEPEPSEEPLAEPERADLEGRIERLQRRREQLGPVNPLAQQEYAEAIEHVEELERQRDDLETALRELRGLIRDTDQRIRESFEETFTAAAKSFEEVVGHLFPGGRGRLRLVKEDAGPRPVLGGADESAPDDDERIEEAAEAEEAGPDDGMGVEIEITPAGKATKRLSLLSGGEKSLTALAFLFAVFLARPCPFYILDEVEAALDDLNIDRFLTLLRRFSDRAQFIVVTHQKRTMEAADCLYGVSMAGNGVSKVISRRLPPPRPVDEAAA
jgi:chromosome segregation protein